MLQGLRVLVADGELEKMRAAVAGAHGDVRTAPDGASALAEVRPPWVPHALVTPAALPDMSGRDLVERVRKLAGSPVAAVGLITGPAGVRYTHLSGFEIAICEPASAADLRVAVLDAVRLARGG